MSEADDYFTFVQGSKFTQCATSALSRSLKIVYLRYPLFLVVPAYIAGKCMFQTISYFYFIFLEFSVEMFT